MSRTKVKWCGHETADEKQKTFSIDDILTVAAATYCESVGKTARDYNLVPVHCRTYTITNYPLPNITEQFASSVPEGTEKVTDYRLTVGMNNYAGVQYATGTALIPKK